MTLHKATSPALLLACAALWLAMPGGLPHDAEAATSWSLPLRVHLLKSSVDALDGASVIGASEIREKIRRVNTAFAPAGVSWHIDRIEVERVQDSGPYRAAVRDDGPRGKALLSLVDTRHLMAPRGWDLYVARDLSKLDLGGAYKCSVDGIRGHGAAFIGAHNAKGKPHPTRKWAHDLGHAMGLSHTPCEPELKDRLMMSGRCEHAAPKRIALDARERRQIARQAQIGGPAACK